MRRKVTYEAADRKAGMTPDELRQALQKALKITGVRVAGWSKGIRSIDIEEADQ